MKPDSARTTREAPRPVVTLGSETETPAGWRTDVRIVWPAGQVATAIVTLSWADHDLITGGACAPSITMSAATSIAAEHFGPPNGPVGLPPRLDIATLRRAIPSLDHDVRDRIDEPISHAPDA